MKKILLVGCLLIAIGISCQKSEVGYMHTLRVIKTLFEEKKYMESLEHMTVGTRKSIRRLSSHFPEIVEVGFGIGVLFRRGAEWKVIKEVVQRDVAIVKIRFVRHPVENVVGSETEFIFRKEDNEWKLDMQKEIEKVLDDLNRK